jgi:membrane protein implicated in regulation of membrane protease activity
MMTDSIVPSWFPGLMSLEAAAVALWVVAVLVLLVHNRWKRKTSDRASKERQNREMLDSKLRRMRRHE